MKKGFQIEIQKDLSEKEYKDAIEFANDWISQTCDNDMVFRLGGKTGGWHSYIKRGVFGFMPYRDNNLVFRRISTSRRVFGIVKADTMTKPDGLEVNLNRCACSNCRGGERVIWRDNKKPKTFIYATVGEIKG